MKKLHQGRILTGVIEQLPLNQLELAAEIFKVNKMTITRMKEYEFISSKYILMLKDECGISPLRFFTYDDENPKNELLNVLNVLAQMCKGNQIDWEQEDLTALSELVLKRLAKKLEGN